MFILEPQQKNRTMDIGSKTLLINQFNTPFYRP